MRTLTPIFIVTALVSGCAKHSATYEQGKATGTSEESQALYGEAIQLWNARDDGPHLTSALEKFEAAYNADPTNRDAAMMLTRGWYWHGDVKVDDQEAKLAAWDTAVSWGGRCMAVNSEFTALLQKGDESERTAIRAMKEEDAGCLYWTASALGKWAKLKGFTTLLKHKDTVKAYITRVGELNASYFYAGPDRYWGAYYAVAPSFAGGDVTKSGEHFDKSLEAQPAYLGTKVLKASLYATKMQDPDLFDQLLSDVLAADADAIPELGPENRAEQAKAKKLQATKSDYFAN